MLTPRLVRLEWDACGAGRFEDRATLAVVSRRLGPPGAPPPAFSVRRSEGGAVVAVSTDALELRYDARGAPRGALTAASLSVRGRAPRGWRWAPGAAAAGTLGGTVRTLDRARGAVPLNCSAATQAALGALPDLCELGVLSRDGWALLNDTGRAAVAAGGWAAPRACAGATDLYLFAHGPREHRAALADLAALAGGPVRPPRFAFGAWWSRYWNYAQYEVRALVEGFDRRGLPLDAVVMDMDWHRTFYDEERRGVVDQAGQPIGWGGFTVDKDYYPDLDGLFAWLRDRGLEGTLNLHPASGVEPWEAGYECAAEAMGVDPATKRFVLYDIVNKTFVDSLHACVLARLPAKFWWVDYQQWENTTLPGVSASAWGNRVFFNYSLANTMRSGRLPESLFTGGGGEASEGGNNGLVMARFGGIGSHRTPVGFSGDVWVTWDSLAFQPRFTATAANLMFGYWSHDLGGHTGTDVVAIADAELYVRWLQWGLYAPIFRTHSTRKAIFERRPWAWPLRESDILTGVYTRRAALVPWLYSLAVAAETSGVVGVRHLYIDYPNEPGAYAAAEGAQFTLGGSLTVAPAVTPGDNVTQLASVGVWVPPGRWVMDGGEWLDGPANLTFGLALEEMAVLRRAGDMIPTRAASPGESLLGTAAQLPPTLRFEVALGGAEGGRGAVYEDGAGGLGWLNASWGLMNDSRAADNVLGAAFVAPKVGGNAVGTIERAVEWQFIGVWPPLDVSVDGEAAHSCELQHAPAAGVSQRLQCPDGASACWWWDASSLALTVRAQGLRSHAMNASFEAPLTDARLGSGLMRRVARAQRLKTLADLEWQDVYGDKSSPLPSPALLRASTVAERATMASNRGPGAAAYVAAAIDSLPSLRMLQGKTWTHVRIQLP